MKARAVIEAVLVFSLTLGVVALAGMSPLGAWGRQATGQNFVEYAVMIAVPLLLLVITRRSLSSYGISFRNPRYHLDIAAMAFVPVAVGAVPLAFVEHASWSGALIMVVVEVAVLIAVAWMLRRKPTRNEGGIVVGGLLLVASSTLIPQAPAAKAILAFLFYLVLGLGEELLFRGYIQSRLNEAFGRPHRFFGVSWGWGLIIASVIFGAMHIVNTWSIIAGHWQPEWWWGLWTAFSGLSLGFVREKTGSIAAPAILHGLPQAIFAAFTALGALG